MRIGKTAQVSRVKPQGLKIFSLARPRRQWVRGGDIHIDPQEVLGTPMVRRLAITLQVRPGHPTALVDCLHGTGLQGAHHRRWLRTARPTKGPLDRRINADRAITLGDGLGTTEAPQEAIEDLLNGARVHGLLGELHLFPQGGKEHCRRRYSPKAHRLARLVVIMISFAMANAYLAKGRDRIATPWMQYISLQEFAFGAVASR